MKIIGVTGGVGAGKSAVLQYITTHYEVKVFYADTIALELQKKGGPCYQPLITLLGKECLDESLEWNRKAVANRIFQDKSLLEKVNTIVHPAVKTYLLEQFALAEHQGVELVFVEAALLIEAGYKNVVDEMWVVCAEKEIREKRLAENRGYTAERTRNIMQHQLSQDAFLQEADVVIYNNDDFEHTIRQIRERLEMYTWHN